MLLLNELKVKTPPTHDDYDYVCKALEKVSGMADYIDRENKFAEMYQRILQIQNGIVDKVVNGIFIFLSLKHAKILLFDSLDSFIG